jgi:asparagine synthase (glutamine-hydrolysing)
MQSDHDGVRCVLEGCLYSDAPDTGEPPFGADAQTVAGVYRRATLAGFSALRGRYAAAVWDAKNRTGAIASDVLSVSEIFWCRHGRNLLFATELEALLELAPCTPGPDEATLTGWLATGTCPEDSTFFEGVRRLAPGTAIPLGEQSADVRRYWSPIYSGLQRGSIKEHAEMLRSELSKAVGRRQPEGTTGVILSGGVDSSVVTAVAARAKSPVSTVRTYSAVFPGAPYDESLKVRQLTGSLGIEPTFLKVEPRGALWLALRSASRSRTPLVAPGALIEFAATQAAADDGVDVLFDGQTGDELFGFAKYLIADQVRRLRWASAFRLAGRWPSGRRTTQRERRKILYAIGLRGAMPYGREKCVRRRSAAAHGATWLVPEVREQQLKRDDEWRWKRDYRGPLWWRRLADTLVLAPHRELRIAYVRERGALAGVVADPPLYDVDLIAHTLRIPPELAFDSSFARPVVREAMRGWLPEEVRLQRSKADLTEFVLKTMRGPDAAGLAELLLNPRAEIAAYANLDWVRRTWADLSAGRIGGSVSPPLWRMVAAECWLRQQADPHFAQEMLSRPDVPAPLAQRNPTFG